MRALVTGAVWLHRRARGRALRLAAARTWSRSTATVPTVPAVEFVVGDVLDPGAVGRAVDGCDAVFHLAAVYSYARRDAALMEAVNVEGTRTVLDAALRGPARRIVHTSSCATCGPVRGPPRDRA